ncbi:hypothetical protein DPQ22_04065 [Candidatus Tokpelaia sp.]|nr:hypothetical protein DPQ22_04065 [Candidatus Tokpelaia sp.]
MKKRRDRSCLCRQERLLQSKDRWNFCAVECADSVLLLCLTGGSKVSRSGFCQWLHWGLLLGRQK